MLDRTAPISVFPASRLAHSTGACYSVESSSASLAPVIGSGIFCFTPDGTLTAAKIGAGDAYDIRLRGRGAADDDAARADLRRSGCADQSSADDAVSLRPARGPPAPATAGRAHICTGPGRQAAPRAPKFRQIRAWRRHGTLKFRTFARRSPLAARCSPLEPGRPAQMGPVARPASHSAGVLAKSRPDHVGLRRYVAGAPPSPPRRGPIRAAPRRGVCAGCLSLASSCAAPSLVSPAGIPVDPARHCRRPSGTTAYAT